MAHQVGAQIVTLTGTSFMKNHEPTARVSIARQDIVRYEADGWDVFDFGIETVAERRLPIFDGEVGLLAALSAENFYLSAEGKPHNGGGRIRGYVLVNARWRALDLDGLVDRQNYYEQGRLQLAAFERVFSLLTRLKGTELVFMDGAFRFPVSRSAAKSVAMAGGPPFREGKPFS